MTAPRVKMVKHLSLEERVAEGRQARGRTSSHSAWRRASDRPTWNAPNISPRGAIWNRLWRKRRSPSTRLAWTRKACVPRTHSWPRRASRWDEWTRPKCTSAGSNRIERPLTAPARPLGGAASWLLQKQTVIRMKQSGTSEEPGPLIADIVYEKPGRKLVPRLHVRKQESQAVCTKRVHGVGQWFQCLLAKMRESQAAANQ